MTIEIDFKTVAKWIMAVAVLVMLMAVIVSSGCVTAGKTTYKFLDDLSGTPYPTPTPTAQITQIPDRVTVPPVVAAVLPIQTESPGDYMNRTNGRNEGEFFKMFRENVTGYQNLLIYSAVYGHKIVPSYHTWSDEWAIYFQEQPRPGNKYLFVYIVTWVDTISGDDARPYGFDADHFRVQIAGRSYEPVRYYEPSWRVKEMETVHDFNDVGYIKPYGYLIRFDNNEGWIADPLGWIKGGQSNAWDGYLIYEIPESAQPADIKVIGRFENIGGWAWWQLK